MNPEVHKGDTVRFAKTLIAGPEPHPVDEGKVVGETRHTLAIRLPGQRALFRCFRQGDVEFVQA